MHSTSLLWLLKEFRGWNLQNFIPSASAYAFGQRPNFLKQELRLRPNVILCPGSLGQMTHWPSIRCSKNFFFHNFLSLDFFFYIFFFIKLQNENKKSIRNYEKKYLECQMLGRQVFTAQQTSILYCRLLDLTSNATRQAKTTY